MRIRSLAFGLIVVLTGCTSLHPPRRPAPSAPPARVVEPTPPPRPVDRPPPPALEPQLDPERTSELRAEAIEAIDAGEASAAAVRVDQLDASQQQRLAIAQILFREAREALLADDFARASTLAGKARVLVEELPTE